MIFKIAFFCLLTCSTFASELIEMGKGLYGDPYVLSWGEGAKLKIGKYCSIAGAVSVILGEGIDMTG